MKHIARNRKFARMGVGIGALCFVVGGLMIWQGVADAGDALMIFGGLLLFVSAILLSRTPPGGLDARR